MKRSNLMLLFVLLLSLLLMVMPALAQEPSSNSTPPSSEVIATTEADSGSTVVDVPAGGETTVNVNPAPAALPDTSLIPGLSDSTLLTVGIIVLVIAHMVTQGRSTALLAKYVDPELAMKITGIQQDSFKMGLEAGLNTSRLTPGLEDDQSWIARAQANGYAVKEEGGRYVLTKAAGAASL